MYRISSVRYEAFVANQLIATDTVHWLYFSMDGASQTGYKKKVRRDKSGTKPAEVRILDTPCEKVSKIWMKYI